MTTYESVVFPLESNPNCLLCGDNQPVKEGEATKPIEKETEVKTEEKTEVKPEEKTEVKTDPKSNVKKVDKNV